MNKIKHITDKEQNKYEKIKKDITFKSSESNNLISIDEFNDRIYNKKVNVLDKYINKIDEINIKADGKGLLDFLKDDSKYEYELFEYKKTIQNDLDKLETCSKCSCLECSIQCPFKSCRECSPNVRVAGCDRNRYQITTGYKGITLYLDDEKINYEIVGILRDIQENKKYIYLSEINNSNNQQLLEYIKHLDGSEEFPALPNEETLDRIYEIFLKYNVCK